MASETPRSPVQQQESVITEPACTPDLRVKSKVLQSQFDETLTKQLEVGIKNPPRRPSAARAQKAENDEELMRAWEEVALTSHAAETGDKDVLKCLSKKSEWSSSGEKPVHSAEVASVSVTPSSKSKKEERVIKKPVSQQNVKQTAEEGVISSAGSQRNAEQTVSGDFKSKTACDESPLPWCQIPSVGTWLFPIVRPVVQEAEELTKDTMQDEHNAAISFVMESMTPSRARRPRLTAKKRQTPNTRSPARMSSPAFMRVPPHSAKKERDTDLPQELFPAPVSESEVSIKLGDTELEHQVSVNSEVVVTAEVAEAQQLEAEAQKEMQEAQQALTAQPVIQSSETQATRAQSPNKFRSKSPQKPQVGTSNRELREAKPSKASAQPKAAASVSSVRPRSPTPVSSKAAAKAVLAKAKAAPRAVSPGSVRPRGAAAPVATKAASRVSPSRERPGVANAKRSTSPRPAQPEAKAKATTTAGAAGRTSPTRERPVGAAKAPADAISRGRTSPTRERPVAAAKSSADTVCGSRTSPTRERPVAAAKAKGSMSPRSVQPVAKVKSLAVKATEKEVETPRAKMSRAAHADAEIRAKTPRPAHAEAETGAKTPRPADADAELQHSAEMKPGEAQSLSVSKKQSTLSSAELEAVKIEAHMREVQKLKERNARTMQRMAAKRAAAKENCEGENRIVTPVDKLPKEEEENSGDKENVPQMNNVAPAPLGKILTPHSPNESKTPDESKQSPVLQNVIR